MIFHSFANLVLAPLMFSPSPGLREAGLHCIGMCPITPHLLQKHVFNSYAISCLNLLILIKRQQRFFDINLDAYPCEPSSSDFARLNIHFYGSSNRFAILKRASLLKYSISKSVNCAQMNIFSSLKHCFLKLGLHCITAK